MAIARKGLGRGLSALIPDDDMEFLSRIARGDTVLAADTAPPPNTLRQVKSEVSGEVEQKSQAKPVAKSANGHVSRETLKKQPKSAVSHSTVPHSIEIRPANSSATSLTSPLNTVESPLASDSAQSAADPQSTAVTPALVEWIKTSAIEANPFQPRRTFSPVEMQELIDSVRSHGILQPILVRPLASQEGRRFQLVAGERRWRAACEAGLEVVPAVIRVIADQQALELAVIENVQRHDISAVDAALAYKRLANEFGLSQDSIARRVGKSRSAVANTMRLLDLPAEAQKAIEVGELTEGHGRAILLAATEGARRAVFRRILRDGLSVREAEAAARRSIHSQTESSASGQGAKATAELEVELQGVAEELQKALGTRLKIKPKGQHGKGGQILIEYFSDQDLQRLLGLFRNSKRGA